MYSGTTLHTKSGRVIGVHQKIDRVARRHITPYIPAGVTFPTSRMILHFEGKNGPDGLKGKSPGQDEPWHFIDPSDPGKSPLLGLMQDNIVNLRHALAGHNLERAAFEAAWLAHTVTDGLTPAHHFPYDKELEKIRGEHHMTRDSRRKKAIMPGMTGRQLVRNNWQYWGAGGLLNKHLQFEMGVAYAVATMKFDTLSFGAPLREQLATDGFEAVFLESLDRVANKHMYEEFVDKGWTRHLARETNDFLVPEIIRTVMLGWLAAIPESQQ